MDSSLFGISIGNTTSSHVSMIFPLTLTSGRLPLIRFSGEEASYSLSALCVCFVPFKIMWQMNQEEKITISWLVFIQSEN